jgi:hypothetical protein
MINITLIQEPDAIFEYRQIWNGLFDNGNFEPSTSFEWTNALRINHAELFTKFFLLIVKRNQDLVGILPFIAKEDRFFTSRLTTIMPISELYNTHSDLLTLEYSDEFCKEIYLLNGIYFALPDS